MTGVSVNCNNWDAEQEQAVNIYKTLNTFSPLSLIQYFTLPNATTLEKDFQFVQASVNSDMELKYKLLVYSRTGMHMTLKYGDMPLIRPMFY